MLMLAAALGTAQTTQGSTGEPEPPPSPTLIQLVDPLDEPEFYCVDVPGFRASLNLEGALTAHTCKPGADDELFTVGHPLAGNLYMPAYDRCVEADGATDGSELYLEALCGRAAAAVQCSRTAASFGWTPQREARPKRRTAWRSSPARANRPAARAICVATCS